MGINATTIRGLWEYHHYADCAAIHLDRRLPDVLDSVLRDARDEGDENRDVRLVMDLELIEGVESVSLIGYCCQVIKGSVFDWEEIKGPVQDVIGRHFGASIEVLPARPRNYRTPKPQEAP